MVDASIPTEAVEADLSDKELHEYPSGQLGVPLPTDTPAYVRAYRIMGDVNGARGLLGWVVRVDAFTFGVSIYMRFGRDGTFKVMSEDSEGKEILSVWEK